ncbi:S8 family peptidase [Flagellimonas sp.]|uniref:S8 family peptidase n=1 Tax=Flagellimonas sp. TaxID=2058762 RepID=UPI003B5B9310
MEIDGNQYEGDLYDGVTTWYKDTAGNFYWSGGIDAKDAIPTEPSSSDFWFEKLDIGHIWSMYEEQGDRCNVLILDTGINDNLNVFKDALNQAPLNFVASSKTTKSIDKLRHGTHCAGLIASRPIDFEVGIAPQSKLIVGKINEHGWLKDAASINAALTEFLKAEYDNKIDLISISQSLGLSDNTMEELIKKHIAKNRVVVTAIGNDGFKENLNTKKYPGFYEVPISVGSCESDNSLSNYTCFPSAVDVFCYGTNIKSYTEENYPIPLSGTSQATAIVSGICALIISALKKKNQPISCDSIKNLLKSTAAPLKTNNQYKLIQPKAIFESIF